MDQGCPGPWVLICTMEGVGMVLCWWLGRYSRGRPACAESAALCSGCLPVLRCAVLCLGLVGLDLDWPGVWLEGEGGGGQKTSRGSEGWW
jgi:uncharacterized protein YodC (DUF2158 family)